LPLKAQHFSCTLVHPMRGHPSTRLNLHWCRMLRSSNASRRIVPRLQSRKSLSVAKTLTTLLLYMSPDLNQICSSLYLLYNAVFLADGTKDPNFPGTFGLAWYQSDLNADDDGNAHIHFKRPLRSIFLDQIFGFDGDKNSDGTIILPPVNTYHVGFCFNNPADAAPYGFDVTKPTPFNGEHQAGPLAMISIPVAATNLGPLCVSPEEGTPCNPPQ
jgi:hypothetical protein